VGLLVILPIGIAVGYIAHRYGFCIFGSIVEALTLGSGRRLLSVFSAMFVFGLVARLAAFQPDVELAGIRHGLGGLLQGMGYYLAVGCPLSLLVRLGEGSKTHGVVFVAFIAGVALYVGLLQGVLESTFSTLTLTTAVTLGDLW